MSASQLWRRHSFFNYTYMGVSNLIYHLKSGKNVKALFFACGALRDIVPDAWYRARKSAILRDVENRSDYSYILDRVNYYNKLDAPASLGTDSILAGNIHKAKHFSSYYYDTREISHYFPASAKVRLEWGDVTTVPPFPSIVKSRPIAGDNLNSVVLKLDKIRHFITVNDPVKWDDKLPIVYFRGKIPHKEKRERFFNLYFDNPLCNLGDSSRHGNPKWKVAKSTIREHLNYRYILALEGNDVASNLKWVMSSRSLAVMPKPEFETWFMEGRLIPDVHYLEIREDYSDLEERIAYCESHPEFVQNIIKNANEYMAQFADSRRERIISLLVFEKYLRLTR